MAEFETKSVRDMGAKVGADQPSRETAVHRELDLLHQAVERVSNVGGALVDRLHPILGPENPTKESDKKLIPGTVPLAEGIRQARMQLEEIADALMRVKDRLEI